MLLWSTIAAPDGISHPNVIVIFDNDESYFFMILNPVGERGTEQ